MIPAAPFRRALLAWYGRNLRTLPWRGERPDFYRVWVSEIMLQQTRVEAVIPYYERFLARFPDVHALASACETDVLAAWSGLGYYSRARNLHRGSQQVAESGIPADYDQLRRLRGIGPYTAAAVASIALGQPHAALDGNVIRVVSRLTNDAGEVSSLSTQRRFAAEAQRLLHPGRPGDFNQAMMELGATVCVPRSPRCHECPVARYCAARAAGSQNQLPVKLKKAQVREVTVELAMLERKSVSGIDIYLVQRAGDERRMAGFWELPGKNQLDGWRGRASFEVSHQIVNDRFRIQIWRGVAPPNLPAGKWFRLDELQAVPVTTVTRKALVAAGATRTPIRTR